MTAPLDPQACADSEVDLLNVGIKVANYQAAIGAVLSNRICNCYADDPCRHRHQDPGLLERGI